ncbi:MAG TPA: HepT-like ribonuclease domain-containing protein [Bryobacteraceae bacterium]|nr:HepT-like ribonuclease domain-containing protein [Bryobacteraceae bacterium]
MADIIENVDAIEVFTAELDFSTFRLDRKTVYAVVRALEIISEASKRLPNDLIRRC